MLVLSALRGPRYVAIDEAGRFVVEEQYDSITDASQERMFIKLGAKWALHGQGRLHRSRGCSGHPARYDTVHDFGDVTANNPPAPPSWTR
ncbi:MAG: WG repeat-containing protein [Myxococcota bacterium]